MSGSPKPASRWGRMGGVVRRASSVLVATRPSTPSIASDRDADATSLRSQRVDTTPATLTPPPAPVTHVPSPIAESPAREAAASQEEVAHLGPSPLARNENNVVPDPNEVTSPVGYIPPPVIDSSAGNPGAFTDEPEDLPQPIVITDPFAPSSTDGHASSQHEASAPVDVPAPPQDVTEGQAPEQVFTGEPQPVEEAPAVEANRDIQPPVIEERQDPQPPVIEEHQDPQPPVVEETKQSEETRTVDIPADETQPEEVHTAVEMPQVPVFSAPVSYFDNPMVQSQGDVDSINQPNIPFVEPVHQRDMGFSVPDAGPTEVVSRDIAPEVFSHQAEPFDRGMVEQPNMPVPTHVQHQSEAPSYSLPNYDIRSDQEIWGGSNQPQPYEDNRAIEMPREHVEHNQPSHASSVRQLPLADPFADPLVPRITLSQHDYVLNMPHPQASEPHDQEPYETHEDAQGAIIMPLPAFASRSLHNGPSNESLNGNGHGNYVETDERQPLLANQGTSKHQSYLQPSSYNHLIISAQSPAQSSSTWHSTVAPRLHDLGWIEYHLPDGTFYYVHPTRRVTTDINLRTEKMLSAVTSFFDEHKDSAGAPVGAELWLRDIGNTKRGFIPLRCWVDHHSRAVIMDRAHYPGKGKRVAEDDQLDMEYRYWSFMESHPAHTTLPAKAKGEALDVLTWAWTDRLLPSHSAIAAPFTQEECQNLTNLLHSSTGDNQGDAGIQTLIVSRILLRVAHWRQHHFRPNKSLPKDANVNAIRFPVHRRPFRRAFFDFVISCFCLGIPYLFFQRSQHHRLDEESGLRNAGPILVIGACTCLVAAIVLSASVTFLSLPGLDSFARVAGLVAILFASFSMASTVVAIFRYKADMERGVSHVGGEGMVSLSKRTVVMSLPLVFLAYAVIGFVAGIVLYSFRGVTTSDPAMIKNHFDDYTKWTVVGVLGGLAGMLTTSFLLIRQ